MRGAFYPKLAWNGIRKNKRLYLPYILAGSVMVMMFYILSFLSDSPAIAEMRGGSVVESILPLGSNVIGIFSILFLFYTNSFLIRQRYHEFGLYNVLGMDKRNIGKIMVWECFIVGIIAIVLGLVAGVALSKAAELVLLNLLGIDINYELSIGFKALGQTILIFGVIYLLLLCNSLLRVRHSKPLELMKSNKVGERLPKRIWPEAILGVILLGVAYYLAISIEEPLAAFSAFFVAVILVICGTYEIFMAGSVVFCKLLQKNKRYYYNKKHFVSVSSMVYRMRRNGAGLASICILLTMVLVMASFTTSLYFGMDNTLNARYPNGVNIAVSFADFGGISDENIAELQSDIKEECGIDGELDGIRNGKIPGLFTEKGITIVPDEDADYFISTYNNLGYLYLISLADYNRIAETDYTLADDECLLYSVHNEFTYDTFTMEYGEPYKVKSVLDDFSYDEYLGVFSMPVVYIVVNDIEAFAKPVLSMKNSADEPIVLFDWHCGFDVDTAEEEIATANAIKEMFNQADGGNIYSCNVVSREDKREDFFNLYGCLFFLGIMLSIVFLLAAVLIIYYKQISEGYEDQSRFEIMQKVGMTKRDIKKSINSQILTVFFLPLIFAGIHLCFAFPFIWKMLMLFGLNNLPFIIVVMLICFGIFGVFYAVVYKITSNAYYSIVSSGK